MIDFAKITKTLDGYDCHYFGTRESYGTKLHCFGVMTVNGVMEKCYDHLGRHLFCNTTLREWEVSKTNAFAIVKPPKIVEVTRWFRFEYDEGCQDNCYVEIYIDKPNSTPSTLDIQQHTFRFEVPHD